MVSGQNIIGQNFTKQTQCENGTIHIVKHFLGFLQLGVQGHTQTKKTIIHNEVRYFNCRSVTISITT